MIFPEIATTISAKMFGCVRYVSKRFDFNAYMLLEI